MHTMSVMNPQRNKSHTARLGDFAGYQLNQNPHYLSDQFSIEKFLHLLFHELLCNSVVRPNLFGR